MPAAKASLDDLRREIDEIDSALHDLLMRRTEVVGSIAAAKGENAFHIHPGREAQVLRRLVARHRGPFPKAVLMRIWRDIIGAVTALQGPLAVAVYAPDGDTELLIRARDHYGALTPLTGYESTMGVLRAVSEGQATFGVLPLPQSDDRDPWWRTLANNSKRVPRVVSRLPFVSMAPSLSEGVDALAVALASHEESGLDRSLLVVETAEQLSRDALTELLSGAEVDVQDIKHWDELPAPRLHLIEVGGYLAPADPRLAELDGSAVEGLKYWVIGGYAVPFTAAELAAAPAREPA